jgi:hypothetical protein
MPNRVPVQTKTKTDISSLTLLGVMAITVTMLLGIFTAQAAVLIARLGEPTPTLEVYDFAGIGVYG